MHDWGFYPGDQRNFGESEQHDESRLPKWAQERLRQERQTVELLRNELERTRQAHAVLVGRSGWHTLPGPPEDAVRGETYKLFYLGSEGAHPACTLGKGDVVLIGRQAVYSPGDPLPDERKRR